ncbi:MAG: hypothetical protein ACKVOE_01540 [Rickettsiales bacterium]
MTADALLGLATDRLNFLLPLLVIGFIAGELGARALWQPLANAVHGVVAAIARKLNRPQRNAATRVYRGIIALSALLAVALLLGLALSDAEPVAHVALALFMLALYGRGFRTVGHLRQAIAARHNRIVVTPPFTDAHGVLRQAMLDSAELFSSHVVGASLWFLIAGPVGMCVYLMLCLTTQHFGTGGFGWAAQQLCEIAQLLPRFIACLLLGLAACFVPHTAPLAASRQWHFRWFVATLAEVSLGGTVVTPAGLVTLPWAGRGTARMETRQFSAWVMVRAVAGLLLLLAVATPAAYPMLLSMYINRL